MKGSVTVHMSAPPERVWDLVSDVARIGEFSPETFEAKWVEGATGPAVGAKFRGHVRRNGWGPVYWTNCVVTGCNPAEVFEFAVVSPKGLHMNTWRYELSASSGGTDVTESFALAEIGPFKLYWALLGWARGKTNRQDMRKTLERMKAVVETN